VTLKEVQELVEAWVGKSPSRHKSELTNMAALTEEVGELARVIAQKHSDPSADPVRLREEMSVELADVLWAICALGNGAGVDLTEALIDTLQKRN
jgi:NTP pyrophosphatase (non-canonical NTP hydrolase)